MRLLLYWGRTKGKETPQRMLNSGTQILPILLTGGGSKGNNGIVTSCATTTDPARQGISMSTRAQDHTYTIDVLLYPLCEENKVNP
jgi:hypothetical protein